MWHFVWSFHSYDLSSPLAVLLSRKVSIPASRHCAKTRSQCCVCKYDIQQCRLLATNLMNQPCYRAPQGAQNNMINAYAAEAVRSPSSTAQSPDSGKRWCHFVGAAASFTGCKGSQSSYIYKSVQNKWAIETPNWVCDGMLIAGGTAHIWLVDYWEVSGE